jgi:hypothetical protein
MPGQGLVSPEEYISPVGRLGFVAVSSSEGPIPCKGMAFQRGGLEGIRPD